MAGPRHVPVEDADDVLKQPVAGFVGDVVERVDRCR
jgi:hypothetical protein